MGITKEIPGLGGHIATENGKNLNDNGANDHIPLLEWTL